MRCHKLKTIQPYFDEVVSGKKTFDVRYNDRKFEVGDVLCLMEIDKRDHYTQQVFFTTITYVLDNPIYCKEGYVILGLDPKTQLYSRHYLGMGMMDHDEYVQRRALLAHFICSAITSYTHKTVKVPDTNFAFNIRINPDLNRLQLFVSYDDGHTEDVESMPRDDFLKLLKHILSYKEDV